MSAASPDRASEREEGEVEDGEVLVDDVGKGGARGRDDARILAERGRSPSRPREDRRRDGRRGRHQDPGHGHGGRENSRERGARRETDGREDRGAGTRDGRVAGRERDRDYWGRRERSRSRERLDQDYDRRDHHRHDRRDRDRRDRGGMRERGRRDEGEDAAPLGDEVAEKLERAMAGEERDPENDEAERRRQARLKRLAEIKAKHAARGAAGEAPGDHAPGGGPALPAPGARERSPVAPVIEEPKAPSAVAEDEDEVDIFAATPVDVGAVKKGGKKNAGLVDEYDDAEGYYRWRTGEMLNDRYEVVATFGKGVFGSVLRARDHGGALTLGGLRPEVAIKMARSNDTMFKQAQSERAVLAKLAGTDVENRSHCIRMLDYFDFRGHACLVFESMEMNLRGLVRKVGRGIGLNLGAVRSYAVQLLISLRHLRQNGILHADIKPDNILVSADHTVVKICDFGSAMFRCAPPAGGAVPRNPFRHCPTDASPPPLPAVGTTRSPHTSCRGSTAPPRSSSGSHTTTLWTCGPWRVCCTSCSRAASSSQAGRTTTC